MMLFLVGIAAGIMVLCRGALVNFAVLVTFKSYVLTT